MIVTTNEAHLHAIAAARAADDKSGHEIMVLDVGDIISIVEAFVIVSANNTRAVNAIVDNIELVLWAEHDCKPRAYEGRDTSTWVLLDYGDLIIHVFLDETRAYYDLERLWADAGTIEWMSPERAALGARIAAGAGTFDGNAHDDEDEGALDH